MNFIKGIQKLLFCGVPGSDGTVKYYRMKGFDELSKSHNPEEYSRKYVDEEFERSDIVRYSPSYGFSFDQIEGDAAQAEFVKIAEDEIVGEGAVRSFVLVDFSTPAASDGSYAAVEREFSIIMESEKNSENFYKYSGTLKTCGGKSAGSASSDDDWQTCTFVSAV